MKGLTIAREIKQEEKRAEAMAALAPNLTDTLLVEALAAARTIKHKKSRAEALTALAMQCPSEIRNQILMEVLAEVHEITDVEERAKSIAALAPYMTRDGLRELLQLVRVIESEDYFVGALTSLFPQSRKATRETIMKTLAQRLMKNSWLAASFAAIVPQLVGKLQIIAMSIFQTIEIKRVF